MSKKKDMKQYVVSQFETLIKDGKITIGMALEAAFENGWKEAVERCKPVSSSDDGAEATPPPPAKNPGDGEDKPFRREHLDKVPMLRDFIEKEGLTDQYLNNWNDWVSKNIGVDRWNDNRTVDFLKNAESSFYRSFDWGMTPEGVAFWSSVRKRYDEYGHYCKLNKNC